MLTFYYSLAPNPMKVALFLEEAGLEYDAVPVDGGKGEQFAPAFVALNPNGKIPVLVDGDVTIFDSNAILLHLAETTGQFLPEPTPRARGEMLSWLMFVATGIGPFSGQCVHFRHVAPEPKAYGVERYIFEARRHWGIVNDRLETRPFMLGDRYTLVDMAVWGWARMLPFVLGESRKDEAVWQRFPHLRRLMDRIAARPAASRADAIAGRHRFKQGLDDETRRNLFRHIGSATA